MKKILSLPAAVLMCLIFASGVFAESVEEIGTEPAEEIASEVSRAENETEPSGDYHIGIVTGSANLTADDKGGAHAFILRYGEERVKHVEYPDDFSQDPQVVIDTIVKLAKDPDMKAIIVDPAVDGTAEGFIQVKARRPDILCFAGEAYDKFEDLADNADLICCNDFISRGYMIVRTAHELGCTSLTHITFARHLVYETVSRRAAVMEEACKDFGMDFYMEYAPDPSSYIGVDGAMDYINENIPEWIEKHGTNSAYFVTSDVYLEPLLQKLLEYGGYFIEGNIPTLLTGYPQVLGLDFTGKESAVYNTVIDVQDAIVQRGGAGRIGGCAYPYGFTICAGLAQHAMNVIDGTSELKNKDDILKAFEVFSPGAIWKISEYTSADPDFSTDIAFLAFQDTIIFGAPSYLVGALDVKIPEKYYTLK